MVSTTQIMTLEAFLDQPETKPASEYIDGKVFQKSMPKRKHSLLQSELCRLINNQTKPERFAYAFPELRCTFGGRSLVPDLAIFRWEHIEFDENGIPLNDVFISPDWVIEILSPDQSPNRVMANITHCLKFGCELGWLADPEDQSILIQLPGQMPELYQEADQLIFPKGFPLRLTAKDIFDSLRLI